MRDLAYLKKLIEPSNQWMIYGKKSFQLLNNSGQDSFKKLHSKELIIFKIKLFFKFFSQIIYIYLNQFYPGKNRINGAQNEELDLIANLERDYRHSNYFRHINPAKTKKHLFIKIFDVSNFTKLRRISFKIIVINSYKNYIQAMSFIQQKHTKKMLDAILINISNNIAIYSYFCALFSGIKKANICLNFYTGGGEDLATYAAIKEKIPSHHLAHGLIDVIGLHGPVPLLAYPRFDSVFVYSQDEVDYLNSHLKQTKVQIYPIRQIVNKTNAVMIFMQNKINFSDMANEELNDVVKFFLENKYKIYIKAHPESDNKYLDKFSLIPNITILENSNEITSEILIEKEISYTIAWLSTTHCESLRSGVIPINMTHSWPPQPLTYYPYSRRSLSWDDDRETIELLVNKQSKYDVALNKLLA